MAPDLRGRIRQKLRQRFEYLRRALPATGFRFTVRTLRALRVLPRQAKPSGPLRLLIVSLTPHIGDVVMQMPLIEALRRAHPDARIEFAVEESAAALLRPMVELDHVYALKLGQTPPVSLQLSKQRAWAVVREYRRLLRDCRFDVCLMPRWDNDLFRSNVFAYLVGALRRIGFGWASVPGAQPAPYRDAFLTQAVQGGNGLHEPLRFCWLAAEAGLIPRSALSGVGAVPVAGLQRIAAGVDWPQLADRLGMDPARPFAVIAPGASMRRKMWPVEQWAEVAGALESAGLGIVILSGPSDAAVAAALHEQTGARSILAAGSTTLVESAALLQHAVLFLGNDSGPGHIAGALGTPTVVLFNDAGGGQADAPCAPERNRPAGPFVTTLSPSSSLPPCDGACLAATSHCIQSIEPWMVIEAAFAALHRAAGESSRASNATSEVVVYEADPIEVLLGTYNGERFLREQIDSILAQTYPNVRILARDDGSADNTIAILEEYAARLPDRFRLLPPTAPTGAAKKNFAVLLRESTAPYAAFADQDDVWLPQKLQEQMAAMCGLEARNPKGTPLLVFSDLRVVDERLTTVAESFWQYQRLRPENIHRLSRLLAQNVVTGCTALFNAPLARLGRQMPDSAEMHDWWLALLANVFGKAESVKKPLVLYRQHGRNVLGARPPAASHHVPQWRNHTRRRLGWESLVHQAEGLLRVFDQSLPLAACATLHAFLRCDRSPRRWQRLTTFLRHGFFATDLRWNLATAWYLWDMAAAKKDVPATTAESLPETCVEPNVARDSIPRS